MIRAREAAAWGLTLIGVVCSGASGCGSDAPPEVVLLTTAQWNTDPSVVGDTGYQIWVDVGWPSRHQSCFPLSPNLRIQVNDREAVPMKAGDCEFDVLVKVGPFVDDTPITVRLKDGERLIGEAQYTDLLPGLAARLATPADGQVHAGDPVALSVPPLKYLSSTFGAEFYSFDMLGSVPPFHSFAQASLEADGQSVETTVPALLTGRAALIVTAVWPSNYGSAQSCTGFSSCSSLPNGDTLGPVFVDVAP
jgi:hypothetical protein